MGYEITGHTKLICLLGSPVGHSKSPMMHNEAFRQLGLDYVYLAFDVKPEDLKTTVEGLNTAGICGFNLTMPLKVHILPLLDELTPAARLAGAVNTVIVKKFGGRVEADEIGLPVTSSRLPLPCGASARWSK